MIISPPWSSWLWPAFPFPVISSPPIHSPWPSTMQAWSLLTEKILSSSLWAPLLWAFLLFSYASSAFSSDSNSVETSWSEIFLNSSPKKWSSSFAQLWEPVSDYSTLETSPTYFLLTDFLQLSVSTNVVFCWSLTCLVYLIFKCM